MDQILTALFSKLADQALPTLMLVAALVWLHKSNKTLITALNKERSERLAHLEKSNLECVSDRRLLHEKHDQLWDRFIEHLAAERQKQGGQE
ncbi:MAG: hypothetical protein RLZZ244_1576 [Verrucomicrobiota bacterium]|jgi:hypothetical protein